MNTLWHSLFLFLFLMSFPASVVAGEPLSFEDIVHEEKLELLKKTKNVESSDVVVGTLLVVAEKMLLEGNRAGAIAYAERAARFSPESPQPHFFLSHAIALTEGVSVMRMATEYSTALKLSWKNFRFLSASLGAFGITFLAALSLTALTFLGYAYVCYLPWWIHYFQERLSNRIHPCVLGGFFLLCLYGAFHFVPLFWFLLTSLFFLCFFYREAERKMALFCLGGLLLTSLFFGPLLIVLTPKQSPLLDSMIKNQQVEWAWMEPSRSAIQEQSWQIQFIEASYRMQERDWKGAEQLYREALFKNPDSAEILNNLGNVFFYQNRFDQALKYYQKAIDAAPDTPAAHYNISQVYKEKLLFKEGEEKYRFIQERNPQQVNTYSQHTATYPDYPVIEERFSKGDLWQTLLKLVLQSSPESAQLEHAWRGDFSRTQFILLALFVTLGLSALSLYLASSISGDCCFVCFKATCARCQKKFSNYNMCSDCGKDIKGAVSRKLDTLPKRVYPFFVIPGGGQMILQKPIRALFFMVGFYFLGLLLLVGDLFLSSTAWHLSIEKSPLLFGAFLFLCLFSMYDLFSQRGRFTWHLKGP